MFYEFWVVLCFTFFMAFFILFYLFSLYNFFSNLGIFNYQILATVTIYILFRPVGYTFSLQDYKNGYSFTIGSLRDKYIVWLS